MSSGPLAPARIAVLVSGEGSTMRALVEAAEDPTWGGQVVVVVADRECPAIDWARGRGLTVAVHPLLPGADRAEWDRGLTELVVRADPDLVVCAGFLKLVGEVFLDRFGGRTLNTHNSLLPSFPGTHAPADALAAGIRVTGATVFLVDAGTDTGVIVAQTAVPVEDEDDVARLMERIKTAERAQLSEAVGRMLREGWTVGGRRFHFGSACR